jgi:replicative DNA helicase
MRNDRLPPQAQEAERGVLSAVLRNNAVYDDIRGLVSAADFYLDAHQKVFAQMAGLIAAGKPVDLVILRDRLKAAGHLEDIGGDMYLGDLWEAVPTEANAVYHARIVKEMAGRRRVIHLCNEMTRDVYGRDEPIEQLIARFETDIFRVGEGAADDEPTELFRAVQGVFADIDDRAKGRGPNYIPTGFTDLDRVIGGLHPERLIVLAARPSVGKSAFMLALALAAARQGSGALVFSLEMSVKEFAQRTLATACGVPLNQINGTTALDPSTVTRLAEGAAGCRMPVWIDGRPGHTADTILATCRRAARRHGVKLVVVDYLQLIDHGGHRTDSLAARIGDTTRKLKRLARSLGVPVVCLSQLNREVEKRGDGKPQLSDLRDSGEIEQDADDVLMLWPQDAPVLANGTASPVQEVRVCVEKQRNGPKAIVSLNYVRRFVRFENYTPL